MFQLIVPNFKCFPYREGDDYHEENDDLISYGSGSEDQVLEAALESNIRGSDWLFLVKSLLDDQSDGEVDFNHYGSLTSNG